MHTLAFLAGAMVWSQVSSFLAINVDFQRVENLNTNDCYRKTTLMVNITSCMYPHEEFLPQISASVYAMKTLILRSKTILLEIRELWRERCILVMMGICLLCLFVCWEDSTDIIFPFLTSRVMLHTYLAADIALLFCCLVFQIVELRHHPRIVILGPALVRVWAPDWVPCHFDVERGSAASWHNCSRWSGWPQCWPHHGTSFFACLCNQLLQFYVCNTALWNVWNVK